MNYFKYLSDDITVTFINISVGNIVEYTVIKNNITQFVGRAYINEAPYTFNITDIVRQSYDKSHILELPLEEKTNNYVNIDTWDITVLQPNTVLHGQVLVYPVYLYPNYSHLLDFPYVEDSIGLKIQGGKYMSQLNRYSELLPHIPYLVGENFYFPLALQNTSNQDSVELRVTEGFISENSISLPLVPQKTNEYLLPLQDLLYNRMQLSNQKTITPRTQNTYKMTNIGNNIFQNTEEMFPINFGIYYEENGLIPIEEKTVSITEQHPIVVLNKILPITEELSDFVLVYAINVQSHTPVQMQAAVLEGLDLSLYVGQYLKVSAAIQYVSPGFSNVIITQEVIVANEDDGLLVADNLPIAYIDKCVSPYYLLWQDRMGGYQCQGFSGKSTYSESFKNEYIKASYNIK